MAFGTLGGSANVADRVESTIYRRGAEGSPIARIWTVVAAAGGALAIISLFITWYAAARTASALNSGWLPAIALVLIVAAAALLVGKTVGLIPDTLRLSSDLFTYIVLGGAGALMVLRQLAKGDLHGAVYLLLIPLVLWTVQIASGRRQAGTVEIEQISLGLASIGAYLVVIKRILDSEHATNGWFWGFLAGVVVALAAFVACRQLGILSGFQVALFAALAMSTMILIILLVQVVGDGWPMLSDRPGDFWDGVLRSRSDDDRLGISQGILGSAWIAVFVALLAFPIGIAAAVYLEEYATRSSLPLREALASTRGQGELRKWIAHRITSTLDIMVRNLAGVPSVVYGLLGLFLFVKGNVVTNWFVDRINNFWEGRYDEILIQPSQSTLFAGGVTLAILVLPIVVITASEAVRAVPQSLREGAYGVGATKWEVIRSQVLPFAAPGILTGTLLALSRAVGEAAPLILVGAITGRLAARDSMFDSVEQFVGQFADRFTAMPIVIVDWVAETGRDSGFGPAAAAAIIVLLIFVILMNSVAVLLRNRFEKKRA